MFAQPAQSMFTQPVVNASPAQTLFHELVPTNMSAGVGNPKGDKGLVWRNSVVMLSNSARVKNQELLVFDLDKLTLDKVTPSGNPKYFDSSSNFTLCLYNDRVVVYGGFEEKTGGGLFGGKAKKVGCLGSFEITESGGLQAHWNDIECSGPLYYIKDHTANIVGTRMFVFGGQEEKGTTNDLQIFNLDNIDSTVSSEVIAPTEGSGFVPAPRSKHSSAAIGGKLFIFGGEGANGISLNDLWAFDIDSLRWNMIKTNGYVPYPRMWASLQAVEGKLLLFGGSSGSDMFSPNYGDLTVYKFESNVWEVIIPDNQLQFSGLLHTFDIYHDKLIVAHGPKYYAYQLGDGEYKPTTGGVGVTQKEKQRVSESLRKLFEDKMYADITFRVHGEDIPAHKGILAVRCPHFNKTFTSGMVESTSDVIEVSSMKAETFKALLEYIYCSKASLHEELAKDLFNVSEEYSLPGLKELCEKFLVKHLRVDNIIEIADIVKVFEAKILEKSVLKFLQENIEEVYEKEDLQRLPGSILFQLIKK